jgi:hypothetical protein
MSLNAQSASASAVGLSPMSLGTPLTSGVSPMSLGTPLASPRPTPPRCSAGRWAFMSPGGGRRRDLRAPVLEGWPSTAGEADVALSAYREKLARMGLEREPLWQPSCCDGEQQGLYHAAGRTLGALGGDDYSVRWRGGCSLRATEWVRSLTEAVYGVRGDASWAALEADAGVPAGLEHAVPSAPTVRALAIALQRKVVLLHSESPDSDRIDRRGLVYVFHPDYRLERTLRADEDLAQEILDGCPADAYAWGEFRQWWREHLLATKGGNPALVLVYDAVRRSYAGTARIHASSGGDAAAQAPVVRRLEGAFADATAPERMEAALAGEGPP